MPRIRSVHPDICEDDVLASVSAYAERTFVRLWTALDDEGRAKDNPRLLAAQLYPLHDHVDVERDLAELAAVGLLSRYEAGGKRYLCVKPEAWARYQKPRRRVASKLPPSPPPDNVRPEHGIVGPCPAGGVVGVGDGGELEMEGESEGEDQARPETGVPVDKPSHPLARRALLHIADDEAKVRSIEDGIRRRLHPTAEGPA